MKIASAKLALSQITGEAVSIICIDDEGHCHSVPILEGNTDYQAYLAWLAEGNTPEPADQPESTNA